jgi:polysaccharide pyruvyl transferase CsaB
MRTTPPTWFAAGDRPRIGIAGSYGGLNLGDEAILSVAIRELRAAFAGAEIVVFTREAEHTARHQDVDDVVAARTTPREDLRREVRTLDLLLLGGGGIIYDREVESYLHLARIAERAGVPTATYAVGAGPLERGADRRNVAEALNAMDLVTVREASAQRLLEEVGVEREITVTADPALLLDPDVLPRAALEEEGLDTRRSLVAVSVRDRGGAAAETVAADWHDLLATAADFIVERFDSDVVFVPMERDDIRESHLVIGRMAASDRAAVLRRTYAPSQLRGLMPHFEMAVGMRLHFLIFAACAGVPVAPLPYASKVTSFLESIGVHGVDHTDGASPGSLLARIDCLWDLRDEQLRTVAARLPELQSAARETTRRVTELLGRHASARTA